MATTGELVEVSEPIARSEAFRRLADCHLASSYQLAHAILRDPAEAEDATHDAFVAAWRNWGQLRDVARFEHWFARILVNTCRNRLRRGRNWLKREVRDVSVELRSAADNPFQSAEDRGSLGEALLRLDPNERIAVTLRYYRDLTVDEIAARMGVRPGTVKSRLHYALRKMHAFLDASEVRETLR